MPGKDGGGCWLWLTPGYTLNLAVEQGGSGRGICQMSSVVIITMMVCESLSCQLAGCLRLVRLSRPKVCQTGDQ